MGRIGHDGGLGECLWGFVGTRLHCILLLHLREPLRLPVLERQEYVVLCDGLQGCERPEAADRLFRPLGRMDGDVVKEIVGSGGRRERGRGEEES